MTTITWTPVTERLPDADLTVLVWTKAGEWWSAWHDEHWHDASNGLVLCGDNEPTHWGEPQGPGEAAPAEVEALRKTNAAMAEVLQRMGLTNIVLKVEAARPERTEA